MGLYVTITRESKPGPLGMTLDSPSIYLSFYRLIPLFIGPPSPPPFQRTTVVLSSYILVTDYVKEFLVTQTFNEVT